MLQELPVEVLRDRSARPGRVDPGVDGQRLGRSGEGEGKGQEERGRECPGDGSHAGGLLSDLSNGMAPSHCSTETTVTDLGASVSHSFPACTFAVTGFGATVSGASKVLTLSTLGAVSVSPVADFAAMPLRLASISTGLLGIEVRERQPQLAGRVPGGDGVDARQGYVAVRVAAGVEADRHEGRVLERHVHLEDVVGRREDHLLLVRDDHRLQHVDHLRDVGHPHAVGMAGEDVQVERGQDGVAQAVLLDQEARVAAGQRRVPGAPLVDDQRDLLLRVVLVHDRRVRRDQAVHLERGLEDLGVLGLAEPGGLVRAGAT